MTLLGLIVTLLLLSASTFGVCGGGLSQVLRRELVKIAMYI